MIALLTAAALGASRPHLVYVLTDNLGWGNVGYHRPDNPEIATPVLNSLIQEGVEIDRLYAYKVIVDRYHHDINYSRPAVLQPLTLLPAHRPASRTCQFPQ